MAFPTDVPIIDTMIGLPVPPRERGTYDFMRPLLMDRESREAFEFPAEYMFKGVPETHRADDPEGYVRALLDEMDRYGIRQGMIGVSFEDKVAQHALQQYPDRFVGSCEINPNRGMEGVRNLERAVKELGVRAASVFPAGLYPQLPPNDKKFYPYWAKCMELDIPVFICVGVPGPRIPMEVQYPGYLDEVCWFFPDLRIVMRHGGEPWTALCVKLMLKWPNLYYSTSAFAPKYYPKDIIDFANTRGADKIIYAGYYPMGLSLERIFRELPNVPFKDEVWPKFLRENAARVLKLDS